MLRHEGANRSKDPWRTREIDVISVCRASHKQLAQTLEKLQLSNIEGAHKTDVLHESIQAYRPFGLAV